MQQLATSAMFQKRTLFLVKEQVGFMKLTGAYDVFDPETTEQIASVKEDPGSFLQFLRLVISKRILPTTIYVEDLTNGMEAMRLEKSGGFFTFKVSIFDKNGTYAGCFKSKAITLSGALDVFDANDNQVATIKGKFGSWNYRFNDMNNQEMGMVTKKWDGIGKALFTTADTYMVSINTAAGNNTDEYGMLLLGACLTLDTIYREKR